MEEVTFVGGSEVVRHQAWRNVVQRSGVVDHGQRVDVGAREEAVSRWEASKLTSGKVPLEKTLFDESQYDVDVDGGGKR